MDSDNSDQEIKKAIDEYDDKVFINTINSKESKISENSNEIVFISNDGTQYTKTYEYLGTYDPETNILTWAWSMIELTTEQMKLSRGLLDYGLSLDKESSSSYQTLLKSLLVNSKLLVEGEYILDIYFAMINSIASNRFTFIHREKKYLDKSKKKYIVIYYFIK